MAVDATGKGFAYTGSLRWSVQNCVLTPESVAITGGRALYNDVDEPWSVNYYITDHLGSVRAVTDAIKYANDKGIEVIIHKM